MLLSNSGKHLKIRQSTVEDVPHLFKAYQDERFIGLYRSNNIEQTEEQMREAMMQREKYTPEQLGSLEFVVEHANFGIVGVLVLGDYSPVHFRAEMLIGLFEEKYNYLGLGTEAALLLLDLAFNHYHLNKLYTYVYEYNEISQKMTTKFGFFQEGLLKKHHFLLKEKRFVDLYINGLNIEQFRASNSIRRYSLKLLGRDITQEIPVIELSKDGLSTLEVSEDQKQSFLRAFQAKQLTH